MGSRKLISKEQGGQKQLGAENGSSGKDGGRGIAHGASLHVAKNCANAQQYCNRVRNRERWCASSKHA